MFTQADPRSVPSLAEQNARFYVAMFAARKAGAEKFVVGVVTTPGTDQPKFKPNRGLTLHSGPSSPAAMCADLGSCTTVGSPLTHVSSFPRR